MRWLLPLCALAIAVVCAPSGAQADDMDGWCAQVKKASSIVTCSDVDLREQAIARNKLFEAARAKLSPAAYRELVADQSRWIKSYTAACGVSVDDPPPPMPIPQSVIDCYRRASRARTAYLSDYLSVPNPITSAPPAGSDLPLVTSAPAQSKSAWGGGTSENRRSEEIALAQANGVYRVPVVINGVLPLQFVLDSGAADVSIPADVFLTLLRTGTIDNNDYIG